MDKACGLHLSSAIHLSYISQGKKPRSPFSFTSLANDHFMNVAMTDGGERYRSTENMLASSRSVNEIHYLLFNEGSAK
jgi:hypothetical protein